MSRGIIAIGIDKGDELVGATLTDGSQIVFLASHDGQAIRFDEADVRPMGRPAYGVRGMNLDEEDYIVGMAVTPKDAKKAEADSRKSQGRSRRRSHRHRRDPADQGHADSLRHRERLRQAHSGRRIPSARPRRYGRHQRQDHRAQRQGRRHRAGQRKSPKSC